jgi:NAD(P)-dependent dehydrogenase (short-subunit alcohol dehydrogenase family)
MSKTILVTGANRGIGLEMVKQYAELGDNVLACCRDPDKAIELQTLAKNISNIKIYKLDVNDLSNIDQLATQLSDAPIDILINNAGVGGMDASFGKVEYDDFLSTLKVNTIAPVMIAQALLKQVLKGNDKIIVNISSVLGSIELHQDNSWGHLTYRVSKSALNSATRAMANKLNESKVIVLAMHPGWVQTDMGGKDAHITPEQSVEGIKNFLKSVSLENSGNFFSYEGESLPW